MSVLLFLLFLAALLFGIGRIVVFNIKSRERVTLQSAIRPGLPSLAVAFLLLVVWSSYIQVETGTMGVVTRFGQVVRTLPPGAHAKAPFIEIAEPVSTQTLVVKPSEDAASHDLQIVHTQITLAYHFDSNYVGFLYTQLIDNSDNAIENKIIIPAILEAIKSVMAQYDAQALISQRPKVRDGIEDFVRTRLLSYHIVAENVSITDFKFSDEYDKAIESKVTAQQNAEKAENILKQVRIEAEQKVAAAQGEADALKAQKQQITPELLQLRTIEMLAQKWDGHLPENYYGGTSPLPIVDVFKNAGKK